MKQKKRFNNNPRFNNRSTQRLITRNTVLESSGPCGKLRGTALQLFEKYQQGYKDALMQNDLVLAQTCLQFADHYMRLQNQALQNEQQLRQNSMQQRQSYYTREEEADEMPKLETPSLEIKEESTLTEPLDLTKEEASSPTETTEQEEGKKTLRLKKPQLKKAPTKQPRTPKDRAEPEESVTTPSHTSENQTEA